MSIDNTLSLSKQKHKVYVCFMIDIRMHFIKRSETVVINF